MPFLVATEAYDGLRCWYGSLHWLILGHWGWSGWFDCAVRDVMSLLLAVGVLDFGFCERRSRGTRTIQIRGQRLRDHHPQLHWVSFYTLVDLPGCELPVHL